MLPIYRVLKKDYKNKSTDLLGFLPERRRKQRGNEPLCLSAVKWARILFRELVKDTNSIYIMEVTKK